MPTPVPTGPEVAVLLSSDVRSEPRVAADTIIDQINAGENVTLLEKTPDGGWYHIRNERSVAGWVVAGSLDVPPEIAEQLPLPNEPTGPSLADQFQPIGRTPLSDGTCPDTHPIKGARNTQNEPVYVMPDNPFYDQTESTVCFATQAEAEQAGYQLWQEGVAE